MDYKIIGREKIIGGTDSTRRGRGNGQWQQLYTDLKPGEAVEMKFPTKKLAQKRQINLHGCFRLRREKSLVLHTKIVPKEKQFILYSWVDKREVANATHR